MEEESRLQEIRVRLERKVERLARQYEETKKQYESVVIAMGLLTDPSTKGFSDGKTSIEVDELAGKTLKQALLYVAEKHGGVLSVTPARKFLIEAGVVRNGQSGSNRINSTLMEMAEFERVSRGKYRLAGNPELLKKTTTTVTLGDEMDNYYQEKEDKEYSKILAQETQE